MRAEAGATAGERGGGAVGGIEASLIRIAMPAGGIGLVGGAAGCAVLGRVSQACASRWNAPVLPSSAGVWETTGGAAIGGSALGPLERAVNCSINSTSGLTSTVSGTVLL